MAATINKTYYCWFRKFGGIIGQRNLQRTKSMLSYLTQTKERNIRLNSSLSSHVNWGENNGTLAGRKQTLYSCSRAVTNLRNFKVSFTTDINSSEDMRNYLLGIFMEDKSLSVKQRETFIHITDIVIKTCVNGLPSDELQDSACQVSLDELYYIGCKMHSLENKIGAEAVLRSVPLFKLGATLGHKHAKYTYAQLLNRGAHGVDPDPFEAANLFTELSKEGHGIAQFELAYMFYTGYGVEQNFAKCFSLYQSAADNGVIQAYNTIGKLYISGEGVTKDEVIAVEYFMKGAEAGDPLSYLSLAHCYTHGKGIQLDLKKSFEWNMKAADAGNVTGIYNVGVSYLSGVEVEANYTKAAEYFQNASNLGMPFAQMNLGRMYIQGVGVEQDLEKAKDLFRSAALKYKDAEKLLNELELYEEQLKNNDV